MQEQPKARTLLTREIWGWAFYDFANSAYATALVGTIFGLYFSQVVVGEEGVTLFGARFVGSALWGYIVSVSMAIVAVTAPILGTIADYRASKKRFLFFFCYSGVLTTAVLFWAEPGAVWLAITFYVLSNMGLEWSLVFYNAFLPELTSREEMGRISGFGWALGYVGGVLCLVLNLAIIQRPDWFFLSSANHLPVRVSFVVVAVWWGIFAIPTFLWLRQRRQAPQMEAGASSLRIAFQRLRSTARKINRYRQLVKFLIAFLIYNDGVQTVIVMGAVFAGEALGMTQQQVIPCFIAIHVVAFFGSLFFGYLGDRMTMKKVIHINLFIWSGAVMFVLTITEIWHFWVLSIVVGFVLGGIQASSRALLSRFAPPENSAEFFGFFSASGRFAAILGPFLYGVVRELTGTARLAVVSVLVFFIAGWAIFSMVDEEKGIAEAQAPKL